MIKRGFSGVSMIEVMVAVVIVALALGPIINLLSASNKVSNASVYEILAVHYASELGEQLQRLAPRLKELRASGSIKDILEEPNLQLQLGKTNVQTGPFMVPLAPYGGTDIMLFVSPLDPNFISRQFFVREISVPTATIWTSLNGIFWDVTISLAWKLQNNDPITHYASYSFILRENL